MAMTQDSGGGGLAETAQNAYEFVEERLRDADSSMSPAELAAEYGCGNQHTQNVCSELAQEGVIERVEEGQYVAGDGSGESGSESEVPSLPIEATGSAESGEEDSEDPSADGEAPSEDPDTEGGEDDLSGRDAALVGASTAGAAAFPAMLDEMSTRQMLALVAVVIVAAYLITRDGSGSSSGSETATSSTGGPAEQDRQQSGGLVQ